MKPRHLILLGALAAIWGSSYLLIKYALEDLEPGFIVFARCLVAGAALVAVILVQGGANRAALGDWRRRPGTAIRLGAIAIAVPFLLITFGELEVPSGLTAVLIAPASLFVAMMAPLVDRSEAIDRTQAIGLVVGLVGVALLVGVESIGSLGEFLGALAILGAALSYAFSNFIVKLRYAGMPPISSSAIANISAALLVMPLALATFPAEMPGAGAIASVVALGIVHTALAFVIYYTLIAEVGAGRASLVSYLAPAVALAYGAALLDEPITAAALAGLTLILAGMYLAARTRTAPPEGAEVVERAPAGFRP